MLRKWGTAYADLGGEADPYDMLRRAATVFRHNDRALLDLHEMVEECEMAAVTEAPRPTDGVEQLMEAMHGRGIVLAVATNNSPRAVRVYLEKHELSGFIGSRIYGRENPLRMKPDPDCVERAVVELGVPKERCLMIGDSAADLTAASAYGVGFIGYAEDDTRSAALRRAGDTVLITHSLAWLRDVLL